jgi:hypothetical protein
MDRLHQNEEMAPTFQQKELICKKELIDGQFPHLQMTLIFNQN